MRHSLLLLALLTSIYVHGQENELNSNNINSLFEIKLDSIERVITNNDWRIDTSYYIHYRVKNISNNTLTYITNSCFYYNHYLIKIEGIEYDINAEGGCHMNSISFHELSKEKSFSETEWITSELDFLSKKNINLELVIPIVKDDNDTYRVDGRSFVKNEQKLIFQGQVKFIETHIDNRKKKRKLLFKSKKRVKKSKKI